VAVTEAKENAPVDSARVCRVDVKVPEETDVNKAVDREAYAADEEEKVLDS